MKNLIFNKNLTAKIKIHTAYLEKCLKPRLRPSKD